MAFFMLVTSAIDYEWDIDNGFAFLGLPDRNKKALERMQRGDKVVYYVAKHSKFMAIVEITGDYFYSQKRVWDDPRDLWPHRRLTSPIVAITDFDKGVYIKDIWDNLEFIKNKTKWGSQVQGSLKVMSEHDFDLIEKEIKKNQ